MESRSQNRMTLTLNWQAITGLCTLLTMFGLGSAWYVKAVVRGEMDRAIRELNGTYTRAKACERVHAQLEKRFDSLENRIDLVEEKAL